ncbi:GntR family transcriptional regulator [Jiella avicenniae]|uniref:GntR family transcriptional regulator n=1 Tax=Jiella avicenniae TaxID=2907202 RepID=A0A9X1P2W0_9HYPH|nr:GntR family transcriptional regulator [Jiella avicenniae]MCE7030375.1 GntR family transcriptional regulator [Jiella avicenniae]
MAEMTPDDRQKTTPRPEIAPGEPDRAKKARPGPSPAHGGSRPRPTLAGVARMPARDRAYHDLKFRILEGRLPPGTKLLEAEVASLLGLSRTPVREALIRLEEEDLVEVRPRHGITVKSQSLDDLAQIYDVLSPLEVRAAARLARRGLDDEEARRLSALLDQMERETERGDIVQWSHLDNVFHSELVGLCGNRRLQAALRLCWDQQYRAHMAIVKLRPRPTQSDREHRAIFEAIRAGDERLASHLHAQHRERADRMALSILRRQAGEFSGQG